MRTFRYNRLPDWVPQPAALFNNERPSFNAADVCRPCDIHVDRTREQFRTVNDTSLESCRLVNRSLLHALAAGLIGVGVCSFPRLSPAEPLPGRDRRDQNFTFNENCQFLGSEAVDVTWPNAVLTGSVLGPEKFG